MSHQLMWTDWLPESILNNEKSIDFQILETGNHPEFLVNVFLSYGDPTYVSLQHLSPLGVLPEKFGGGVRPASQNPYPIYDQNLRYSLPYLRPDQIFDTLLNQNPVSDLRYNAFPSSDQC